MLFLEVVVTLLTSWIWEAYHHSGYTESDVPWLLWLGQKRWQGSLSLFLSLVATRDWEPWSICVRTLGTWGCHACETSWRGYLETELSQKPQLIQPTSVWDDPRSALADWLQLHSRRGQNHSAEMLPNFWPTETIWDNDYFCFKWQRFGVTCHVAIWYRKCHSQ